MNEWDRLRRQAAFTSLNYPPGTRLLLISMATSPSCLQKHSA